MATVRHIGYYPKSLELCYVQSIDDVSAHLPFTSTLEELLSFYWRVKRWRISTVGDGIEGDADPQPFSYDYSVVSVPAESEKHLVCGQNILGWTYDNGAPANNDDSLWVYEQQTALVGNYPFFGVRASGVLSYDGGADYEVVGSVYFGSRSWPCYGIRIAEYYVNSADITISAEEYWPYDPGDGGGPIYSSTTGSQLRAFPAN